MANDYTDFSFELDLPDADIPLVEQAWDNFPEVLARSEITQEQIDKAIAFFEFDPAALGHEQWLDIYRETAICRPPNYDVTDGKLHVYADDGEGDPFTAAKFVQTFLQLKGSDELVTFEVAFYCSKPRSESFGGGVFMVTKDDVSYIGTNDIVDALQQSPVVLKQFLAAVGCGSTIVTSEEGRDVLTVPQGAKAMFWDKDENKLYELTAEDKPKHKKLESVIVLLGC